MNDSEAEKSLSHCKIEVHSDAWPEQKKIAFPKKKPNKKKSKKRQKYKNKENQKIDNSQKVIDQKPQVRSQIHYLLKEQNIDIDDCDLFYRKLELSDKEQLEQLNLEWFPISYGKNFYFEVFHEVTNNLAFGAFITHPALQNEYLVGAILLRMEADKFVFSKQLEIENGKKRNYFVRMWHMLKHYWKGSCVGYIMTIGVIDEFRRKGIGKQLLERIQEIAEFQYPKCIGLTLHVVSYNKSAINFYEKNDFLLLKTIQQHYTILESKYDALLFAKYFQNKSHSSTSWKNSLCGCICCKCKRKRTDYTILPKKEKI